MTEVARHGGAPGERNRGVSLEGRGTDTDAGRLRFRVKAFEGRNGGKKMILRIVALVIALAVGTAASQLPEFAQQYRQRLGGAIDALGQVVADFRRDAEAEGLTPEAAVARLKLSADSFARRRGASMERAIDRLDRLVAQWRTLDQAGPVARIAVFLRGPDRELVGATAEDFEPAVPVTIEGLIAALLGLLAGYLGTKATAAGGRGMGRRMRRRRTEVA